MHLQKNKTHNISWALKSLQGPDEYQNPWMLRSFAAAPSQKHAGGSSVASVITVAKEAYESNRRDPFCSKGCWGAMTGSMEEESHQIVLWLLAKLCFIREPLDARCMEWLAREGMRSRRSAMG